MYVCMHVCMCSSHSVLHSIYMFVIRKLHENLYSKCKLAAHTHHHTMVSQQRQAHAKHMVELKCHIDSSYFNMHAWILAARILLRRKGKDVFSNKEKDTDS